MPDEIDAEDQRDRRPDIIKECPGISEDPQCMINKQAGLDDKNGIPHDQEYLTHGIPLVTVVQGAVVGVGDHSPQISDEASFDIDYKNQEEQTEKQEENLKPSGRLRFEDRGSLRWDRFADL